MLSPVSRSPWKEPVMHRMEDHCTAKETTSHATPKQAWVHGKIVFKLFHKKPIRNNKFVN